LVHDWMQAAVAWREASAVLAEPSAAISSSGCPPGAQARDQGTPDNPRAEIIWNEMHFPSQDDRKAPGFGVCVLEAGARQFI
jgi:hypothetical protein